MRLRRLALLLIAVLLLASAADARPRRKLTLRFPRFTLPPGASRELCFLVYLPRTTPLDVASWEVRHKAAPGMSLFHFLVYNYSGEDGAGSDGEEGMRETPRRVLIQRTFRGATGGEHDDRTSSQLGAANHLRGERVASIRRGRQRRNCTRSWPSAGTSTSRSTASMPIRA